jgi:hypothetical protein
MISWKIISFVRVISWIIMIAGCLTGYPAGMAYGLLGLIISYMWSVDKMEDIVKKLDPDNKPEDKDNLDESDEG